MELKSAIKYLDGEIANFEKATFMFENVVKPRYDADVEILKNLKSQALKIRALMQKVERGEELTQEEIFVLPAQFR